MKVRRGTGSQERCGTDCRQVAMLSSAENQTISLSTKTWIWENLSGGGLVCKVRPEHGSAVWVAAGLHLGQVGALSVTVV